MQQTYRYIGTFGTPSCCRRTRRDTSWCTRTAGTYCIGTSDNRTCRPGNRTGTAPSSRWVAVGTSAGRRTAPVGLRCRHCLQQTASAAAGRLTSSKMQLSQDAVMSWSLPKDSDRCRLRCRQKLETCRRLRCAQTSVWRRHWLRCSRTPRNRGGRRGSQPGSRGYRTLQRTQRNAQS